VDAGRSDVPLIELRGPAIKADVYRSGIGLAPCVMCGALVVAGYLSRGATDELAARDVVAWRELVPAPRLPAQDCRRTLRGTGMPR